MANSTRRDVWRPWYIQEAFLEVHHGPSLQNDPDERVGATGQHGIDIICKPNGVHYEATDKVATERNLESLQARLRITEEKEKENQDAILKAEEARSKDKQNKNKS